MIRKGDKEQLEVNWARTSSNFMISLLATNYILEGDIDELANLTQIVMLILTCMNQLEILLLVHSMYHSLEMHIGQEEHKLHRKKFIKMKSLLHAAVASITIVKITGSC